MSTSARERARAQMIAQILTVAGEHLTLHGAAGLSLRAVARDVGLVSSAVYRYIPSRDDLLTRLLIHGYDQLGDTLEAVASASAGQSPAQRWLELALTTRSWARKQPQVWALLYGSPVPGYSAPSDTIDPATRLPRVLLTAVLESYQDGSSLPHSTPAPPSLSEAEAAILQPIRAQLPPGGLPDETLLRALMAWSQLIGSISFELFGHRRGVVLDFEQYFIAEQQRVAFTLGLGPR